MAGLTRKTLFVFGSDATQVTYFGQFGSKVAGLPQTSQDPTTIQSSGGGVPTAAWDQGWQTSIVSGDKAAYLQDMNGWCRVHSYMTGYLYQMGIPEWDPGTLYFTGSIVQNAATGQQFRSLQGGAPGTGPGQIGNAPSVGASNAFWQWTNSSLLPAGVILDFMGVIAPGGFYLADGSLKNRVTDAALFNNVTVQTFGNLTLGSPVVPGIPDTSNLQPGFPMSGTGVATGAKILTVDSGTQVTMTANATGSGTGVALVFAPWGVGDGSTTFNLLDSRRRVSAGSGGVGNSVLGSQAGAYGGEDTHTLTIAEMPSHTHTTDAQKRVGVAPGGPDPTSSSLGAATINPTGGGLPHNNIQPTYVVTKIIKN